MSAYYYFYSPKTGEKIDEGKYVGLPFLWNSEFTDATSLIHSCAVKKDKYYERISQWTIDERSKLWRDYWDNYDQYAPDFIFLYCSKEEILKLQKLMSYNRTLMQKLIEENDCEGLIIEIA